MKVLIDQYWEQIVADRRWLHAHPELSGEEEKTAAYIAESLRKMGLEVQENVGGHGVVALIEGGAPGKCVGLRADFDALPITECTGLPFASETPGVMHACGHDLHAAMLLGAARILNDVKAQFCGSVKLIFQPAEEKGGGALKMIEDGALCNPTVDAMIGQHLDSTHTTGNIVFRNGAMTAASDGFAITVHGKGGHASKPELGIDAIAISAQIISALQNIVSRNVSPLVNSVITIGTIKGGTARNVIAETVEMTGTCRNLDVQTREGMAGKMEAIIKGVAEGMGAGYSFSYNRGYPITRNDSQMCELLDDVATEVLGCEHVIPLENAALGGEDFAYFAEKVPSVYYRIGSHKEGTELWPLHNGKFSPDEDCMKTGVLVMTAAAIRFLNGN